MSVFLNSKAFFLIINITITIVFLVVYSRDQYEKEPKFHGTNVSTAILTLAFNVTWLITALLLIKLLYATKTRDDSYDLFSTNKCTYIAFGFGIWLGPALALGSFFAHCEISSCFQIETPLYVIALFVALSVIALCVCLVLDCIGKYICGLCSRKVDADGQDNVSNETTPLVA